MDNIILGDVKIALSEWPARLQNLSPRYSKPLEPALSRRNKRPTPDDKRSVATVTGQHSTQQAAEDPNQKDRIECPPSPKLSNTKFSTTNGYTIYYYGEAQTTLYQCYEMIDGVGRVLTKRLKVSKKRGFSAAAAALCRCGDGGGPGGDGQKAEKKRRKGKLQKQTEETLEFLNSRLKGRPRVVRTLPSDG